MKSSQNSSICFYSLFIFPSFRAFGTQTWYSNWGRYYRPKNDHNVCQRGGSHSFNSCHNDDFLPEESNSTCISYQGLNYSREERNEHFNSKRHGGDTYYYNDPNCSNNYHYCHEDCHHKKPLDENDSYQNQRGGHDDNIHCNPICHEIFECNYMRYQLSQDHDPHIAKKPTLKMMAIKEMGVIQSKITGTCLILQSKIIAPGWGYLNGDDPPGDDLGAVAYYYHDDIESFDTTQSADICAHLLSWKCWLHVSKIAKMMENVVKFHWQPNRFQEYGIELYSLFDK